MFRGEYTFYKGDTFKKQQNISATKQQSSKQFHLGYQTDLSNFKIFLSVRFWRFQIDFKQFATSATAESRQNGKCCFLYNPLT